MDFERLYFLTLGWLSFTYARNRNKYLWCGMRRAKCVSYTLIVHLDRHLSSEIMFSHIRNQFGSACVERNTFSMCRMCIWIGCCRAKYIFHITKTGLARHVSSETHFTHVEFAFGSAAVERNRVFTLTKLIWIGMCRAKRFTCDL